MPLDPYSPCPCGSGKKLKFCCADLAAEMEKIHRKLEGDQPRAALRDVELLLAKQPDRASLLDLRAMLELAMEDIEGAEKTVSHMLAKHPQSPSAWANQAMLLAQKEKGQEAALALQNALNLLDREMPQRVLEALGATGQALLVAGHVVAALAHLWLYSSISPDGDARALEMIVRLNQMAGLPLMLRERLQLTPWPADAPWHTEAAKASEFADQGKWLAATEIVDQLGQQHGAEPSLVYNRAILGGWLGDDRALVAGLHAFAQLEVPLDDAVDAEAMAQLLDTENREQVIETVRCVFELNNLDEATAKLFASPRAVDYPVDLVGEEGAPLPREAFLLLDRTVPTSGAEITREEVPTTWGFVALYGRQTDRAERLELTMDRGDSFDPAVAALREICGEFLGDVVEEEKVGETNAVEQALGWRWHFPDDVPPGRRRELLTEERTEAIVRRWPNVPRVFLNNKPPREAADDSQLRVPLAAAVLILEQGSNNAQHADAITQLRADLGVPEPQPKTCNENGSQPHVVHIPRMALESVSDENLVQLYRRAMVANAKVAILATCHEALKRPSLADDLPPDEAYQRILAYEEDPARSLSIVDEARKRALEDDESTAPWDLAELQIHLGEGDVDNAKRTLREIDQRHGDNPEVAAAIYQMLYEAGAIAPEDPSFEPEMAGVAEQEAPSEIWTPEGDTRGGSGSSKLWTPD